jgi:hypothetical protein
LCAALHEVDGQCRHAGLAPRLHNQRREHVTLWSHRIYHDGCLPKRCHCCQNIHASH